MARSQRPASPSRPRPCPADRPGRPRAAESAADATRLEPVLVPAGRVLLDGLGDVSGEDPLALSSRLRAAGNDADTVAAVLTQAGLRRAARAKLGALADGMLLTRDGLEQATRAVVAEHRARRLQEAGVRSLADLGCGIGADALVYARAGLDVTAVERDPTVAAAAAANLATLAPAGAARAVTGDAEAWAAAHADEVDALWLDPARRRLGSSGTARVFDPEAFSPPLSFVLGLADGGRPVGVKLGPGLPHEHVPAAAEAEWVSVDGDVVEVTLWFGPLAQAPGRRTATLLDTRGSAVHRLVPAAASSPAVEAVGEEGVDGLVGQVLLEPDGAVIRAGLVTDLAVELGPAVRLLDPHLAYLVAPDAAPHPLARGYRVLAVHEFRTKALARWARETGVGRLDVKKRGVRETPEQVRAAVLGRGTPGGRHATLVLARVGERRVAFEVEPLPAG
ncbi:THUMP-like domain-containing protein [Micrococcus porci]|uniref:THUMP-like domain-containing protein n=1 Tax=Micrococcus porci TaxID=2856555 RepID=UPI003CF81E37